MRCLLYTSSTAGSMNASRPSPLPQTRDEKKIPVFKAGSLGISLRRPLPEQQAAEKQEAKAASTAVQNDATYEDYILSLINILSSKEVFFPTKSYRRSFNGVPVTTIRALSILMDIFPFSMTKEMCIRDRLRDTKRQTFWQRVTVH